MHIYTLLLVKVGTGVFLVPNVPNVPNHIIYEQLERVLSDPLYSLYYYNGSVSVRSCLKSVIVSIVGHNRHLIILSPRHSYTLTSNIFTFHTEPQL